MGNYVARGVTRVFFAAAVADKEAPTEAELAAAIEITEFIAEITGFTFAASKVDTPNLATRFVSNIPGDDQAEDSSITYYDKTLGDANPLRTAMPKGTTGFLVFFPRGLADQDADPAEADECDVWPMEVGSNVQTYTVSTEPSRRRMTVFITSEPALDTTVPATV